MPVQIQRWRFFKMLSLALIIVCGCDSTSADRPGLADEPVRIVCGPMTGPMLDTTLGFLLPVPEHFQPLSDPPTELYGFDSQSGLNMSIEPGPTDSIDKEKWLLLSVRHPSAVLLEFRMRTSEEANGMSIYGYAIIKEEHALFVTSSKVVDLASLLDCLVAR